MKDKSLRILFLAAATLLLLAAAPAATAQQAVVCPNCNGYRTVPYYNPYSGYSTRVTCPTCGGYGYVYVQTPQQQESNNPSFGRQSVKTYEDVPIYYVDSMGNWKYATSITVKEENGDLYAYYQKKKHRVMSSVSKRFDYCFSAPSRYYHFNID